jgi:hypothetical protein
MCSDTWAYYLTSLTERLQQTPSRVGSVAVQDQGASIPGVDFSGGSLNAGVYRISYMARITGVAGTSSSLHVTVSWIDHGVSLAMTGAAMTGNTIATLQQGGGLIYSDAGTPVTYSTTYNSIGTPTMKYQLYVMLETAFLQSVQTP